MKTNPNNTAIIGINSSLPSYRLCWFLNNELDINLVRKPELDICLLSDAGKEEFVPIYQSTSSNGNCTSLYNLENDENYFLPDNKHVDYLWMVQSNCAKNDAKNITEQLLQLPDVQSVKIIATKDLSHFDELVRC